MKRVSQKRLLEYVRGAPDLLPLLLGVAEAHCTPYPSSVLSPAQAHAVVMPYFQGATVERLVAIGLDRRCKVLGGAMLTQGNDAFTIVCPKQIMRFALQCGENGAHGIILAHNHPSGDPTPSREDIAVTKRVAAAAHVLGIVFRDHLVIGAGRCVSMAELGLVPLAGIPNAEVTQ